MKSFFAFVYPLRSLANRSLLQGSLELRVACAQRLVLPRTKVPPGTRSLATPSIASLRSKPTTRPFR
jgi:hypothetical protein